MVIKVLMVPTDLLEKLLEHAALAARCVGHLNDGDQPVLIEQLAEHVDTMVHDLIELFGAATVGAAFPQDTEATSSSVVRVEVPELASRAGGGR